MSQQKAMNINVGKESDKLWENRTSDSRVSVQVNRFIENNFYFNVENLVL